MAGDDAFLDRGEDRFLVRTTLHRVRAARMKAAARRWVERARPLARQNDLVAPFVGVTRQCRREQRLGVGMLRRPRELFRLAALYDLAEIHDHDLMAHMRHR